MHPFVLIFAVLVFFAGFGWPKVLLLLVSIAALFGFFAFLDHMFPWLGIAESFRNSGGRRRGRRSRDRNSNRTDRISTLFVSGPSSASARSSRTSQLSVAPVTALVIKEAAIERILAGEKTWEMRSRHRKQRGPIALAKKGSKAIYGVADLVDCKGPLSDQELKGTVHLHGITPERLSSPELQKLRYAWVLANVRRLPSPIPYVHTPGAQSIVRLDPQTSLAVLRAINSETVLGST